MTAAPSAAAAANSASVRSPLIARAPVGTVRPLRLTTTTSLPDVEQLAGDVGADLAGSEHDVAAHRSSFNMVPCSRLWCGRCCPSMSIVSGGDDTSLTTTTRRGPGVSQASALRGMTVMTGVVRFRSALDHGDRSGVTAHVAPVPGPSARTEREDTRRAGSGRVSSSPSRSARRSSNAAHTPASSSRSGGWPPSASSGTCTCGPLGGGSPWRDVRQAFIPGVFFGLNLAISSPGRRTTASPTPR